MSAAQRNQTVARMTACLAMALAAAMPAAHAQQVTLTETGSTLLAPLFSTWSEAYAKTHPGVHISVGATGSAAGIEQAIAGKVNIGASDAYMSDADAMKHPQIINVPLAIAAQTVNYNLPGLNDTHLKLDGPTLAGIYTGAIHQWDAPAIAALNPGVHLPHHEIVPVRRGDGSGDTFVFTQFLTFSTPSWENSLGYGTTVDWPTVSGAVAATGNAGMVNALKTAPYSVGYIGVSYAKDIAAAGLGTAALKNGAGEFVLPTKATITAGAASLGVRTPPDERLSLVFSPAAGTYPLVNYEYAVVSTKQPSPELAAEIRKLLEWSIVPSDENAAYLEAVHFIPLPPHTWELSITQIESIR
ncbi:phosphate ABC transporter substrate-binding protein PstS [Paraburkholderia sp. Ac-20336]|uniref:phosphate ABC transporter substrate-binding protein PstS n=1 Tax=Paraburkholderia sp. Ac-20336 TaxID=2703886 RepID=UPI001980DEC1|nr:phosphate ABC transporter substrate-binding protein PstS [Paraburkholderia sp. Ac-20336]MBN3806796.1 phosphate ABC transporter substrate-binding protein PstS [Paraburkholderia sp. Ac-20336]